MRLSLCLISVLLVSGALLLVIPGVSLAAVTTTYPAEPWNHLQIYYSVSGVSVGSPTETTGNTHVLEYTGKADSYNIRVTGEFRFSGGTGDNTYINCYAGLYNVPWWSGDAPEPLGDEFEVTYKHGDVVPFDLWLHVPQDQEEVQVILTLEGSYANWQDRGLIVKFKLENPYYGSGSPTDSGGSGTDPSAEAMSPLPLIGAGLLVCLYAIVRRGKKD